MERLTPRSERRDWPTVNTQTGRPEADADWGGGSRKHLAWPPAADLTLTC